MSKRRSVNTYFWSDNFTVDLEPIEKLLFLYLLTNEQTNMLGIYELHIRRISFDTGIDKDKIASIFAHFEESQKAKYCDGYVILLNFIKHQSFNANMEQSAVKTWNNLPKNIRELSFCEPIIKALKGLTKASEPIAELEYELEYELEVEEETHSAYGFNQFWEDYDKKLDRKKSLAKWKKVKEEDRLLIQGFIPVYKAFEPNREFRKNPTTFLNGEIWKDEWNQYPPKQQGGKIGNNHSKADEHVEFAEYLHSVPSS